MAFAVLAGLLIALQAVAIGASTERSGPLVASSLVHLAGLALASLWLAFNVSWTQLSHAVRSPWWTLGGIAGFGIVAAVGTAVNRLGVAVTLAITTATQLLVGLLADAARGTATVAPRNILGVVVLVAGAYLVAAR
jgi:uncharacterized membrane protein YdcZ (DUF606 family)